MPHHAREGVKYPCRQCKYQATEKGALEKHKKTVHEGGKYPCRQCDYKVTSMRNVTQHQRAIREGMKCSCTLVFLKDSC